MRIIFDISHIAHLNFFSNAINQLIKDNDVAITYIKRGKLPHILKKEFPAIDTHCVGSHHGTFLSIIFQANVFKFLRLLRYINKTKPDIGISVGSFNLGTALYLFRKKNIQFDDDPERKMNVFLEKMTATRLFFPPITNPGKKISHFNATKEWAYLSPKYFSANPGTLDTYQLKEKQYIFIREIATGSLNYQSQDMGLISSVSYSLPNTYTYVLSLEDKSKTHLFPKDWIILEEPVEDIHSLIYYSAATISSGDSMAREGAVLGNPSFYCGIREMKVNNLLVEKGMLHIVKPEELSANIEQISAGVFPRTGQDGFRSLLQKDWDDVTDLIINTVFEIKPIEK